MIPGARRAALAALTSLALGVAGLGATPADTASATPAGAATAVTAVTAVAAAAPSPAPAVTARAGGLPGGGRKVFGRDRFLVAYYGTANTATLGVLGESDPDTMHGRLRRAARPFKRPGERLQPVFELIVTVADASPGADGDYNHDILHSLVQRYIDAAHRNGALLVLDVQPGRSDFLTVAKRWEWALQDPWVGLALDPEWRVGPDQVPAQVIGSVSAAEVNAVSGWLDGLTEDGRLPEKVFMVHQFSEGMVRGVKRVEQRGRLAEVLHVDGFGTPAQKRATYARLARPRQFEMGFKLFYDEDSPRLRAGAVRRLRPAVSFVSFQ